MEENKQIFLKVEKFIYVMLVMLSIVLITFLSYLDKVKLLYVCPIVLVLELLVYLMIKNKKNSTKFQNIISDVKKVTNLKKTVYAVATIFTILFIILLVFVIYKIASTKALASLFELLSVNIISFIIFAILICAIFVLANKDTKSDEKNIQEINTEFIKPGKKLTYIVYTLFVMMTCIIPFAYAYFVDSGSLTKVIWVVGILSNLIFGVLTSAILRCARYHNMSYSILGLSIWFVALMGLFSNIISFGLGYTLFIVSVILSLIVIYVVNKISNK